MVDFNIVNQFIDCDIDVNIPQLTKREGSRFPVFICSNSNRAGWYSCQIYIVLCD